LPRGLFYMQRVLVRNAYLESRKDHSWRAAAHDSCQIKKDNANRDSLGGMC